MNPKPRARQLSLLAPWLKLTLWVAACVLVAAEVRHLAGQARAEYAARNPGLSDPLAFDPAGAAFSADLAAARGDAWLRAEPPRPDHALAEYSRALHLDRYDSARWYGYARVADRAGRLDETDRALTTAVALDPNNDRIQAALGDLRLRQGRLDEALGHHARAVALNTYLARSVAPIYWSLGVSPLKVAQTLLGGKPELAPAYWLDALASLTPAEALELWQHFGAIPGALSEPCYRAYFGYLTERRQLERARDLWRQAAREFYQTDWDEAAEPLWNADLGREPRCDWGLEWRRIEPPPAGVTVSLGDGLKPGQPRPIRIEFTGVDNVAFYHLRHAFFVRPGRAYRLRWHAVARELTTDNGLYPAVLLYGARTTRQAGAMLTGSLDAPQALEFTVPDDAGRAELIFCRDRSRKLNNRIRGTVVLDQFVLEELP